MIVDGNKIEGNVIPVMESDDPIKVEVVLES